MVHSSTAPCVVTTAGDSFGSKTLGVAPSTVIKKFVGLAGSLGSDSTSEKYNFLLVLTGVLHTPSKRCFTGQSTEERTRRSEYCDVPASAELSWYGPAFSTSPAIAKTVGFSPSGE
jgi:hypothetical protein